MSLVLHEQDPKTMLTGLLRRWKEVHHVFTTQFPEQLNLDKITITAYPVFSRMFRRLVDLADCAVKYLESVKRNHKDDCSFQRDLREVRQIHGDICSSSVMDPQM